MPVVCDVSRSPANTGAASSGVAMPSVSGHARKGRAGEDME